jgi:DNA-binding response OmpR family regulator
MQREGLPGDPERLAVGDVAVDTWQPHVRLAGKDVWLRRRDWEVLLVLARAGGDVVPRDILHREVWGDRAGRHADRSADAYVFRLRVRLHEADPSRVHIHTHRNVGYRLAPEPAGERNEP